MRQITASRSLTLVQRETSRAASSRRYVTRGGLYWSRDPEPAAFQIALRLSTRSHATASSPLEQGPGFACFDLATVIVVTALVGVAAERITLGSRITVSEILYILILLVLVWRIRNMDGLDASNLIKSDYKIQLLLGSYESRIKAP